MPFSQSDLRTMAAAASTIPERMGGHILSVVELMSDDVLQKRLSAWCQVSTAGNWQRFQERLSWEGIDLPGALHLLAPGVWSEEVPLPSWTTTLREGISSLETAPGESMLAEKGLWAFLNATAPLPFEELLSPFVALAQERFLAQAGMAANMLTDAAQLILQRHLLQTLISLALPTLYAEFAKSRERLSGSNAQSDDRESSRHFIQQMRQGGLVVLLRMYSVLARLLTTTCDLWVEANVEFVQRLFTDWSDLSETFGGGDDLGQVREIQPALSDTHSGRRCVMSLTFARGIKIVYKPRCIGMEEAYASLLRWCNAQGAKPPFKILNILSRDSYGWVEFVAQEPCPDQSALRRYYQRAGMVLCLVYVLGGIHCFSDQLIAHGEHPVLVDTGHLLHPYPRPNPEFRQGEDWEREVYSVLHTALLASWHMPTRQSIASPGGTRHYAADISGLCLGQENKNTAQKIEQQKPSLALKYGSLSVRSPLNIATVVDVSQHLQEEDLREELCTGFRHMYQLLLQQRDSLLAAESPFQVMKRPLARVRYRDRSVYDEIFPKLLAPQALQDAITRSLFLEPIGSESIPIEWYRTSKRDYAHWWPIFAAERQALLQGDIPVVSARGESDVLVVGTEQRVVESCLCQPAFDLVLKRLEHLSNDDLALQLALIQQAIPQQVAPVVSSKQVATVAEQPEARPFMPEAITIADDIVRHAIFTRSGEVLWVKPEASYRFQQNQLQPMRYGLSDGISGIAFFLAALAQVTGDASYARLASAAVQPLHRLVREEGKRLICEMGLGAALGSGSIVYALTRLSQLLDEPELLVDAQAAANLITPDLIAEDHLLDVFVGTAGTLLGLLALHEASPAQNLLDRAVWCGEHLLHTRTLSIAGCRVWPTMGGRHTSGFSHGSAGIVYALLRLYALTGDASLLEAAREGLLYEDHALVYERGNWAEEAGKERLEFGFSWCHGAPGIGLARIGGLPMLDTASIRRDIDVALQTTQQIGVTGPDTLCCGSCGRIEFLLTAARQLDRPELAETAMRVAEQMLSRAEQRGEFSYGSVLPWWIARPHLFHGTAGIGYTLLRLAQPDVLPCLLLWE
jgi:type 2 lantibiotic biosynthesis protein LanM